MASDTLTLTIPVQREALLDLLVTAAEGGSNYWAAFRVAEGSNDDYTAVMVREHEAHSDEKPAFRGVIKAEDLIKGLEALAVATFPTASKHLGDALRQDGDAITADVVLQMAIFGEVIYG